MNINLAKLSEQGFYVHQNKTKGILSILPNDDAIMTNELQKAINEVGALMGFNEIETEELFGAAHKIQVISAIRKCSNW